MTVLSCVGFTAANGDPVGVTKNERVSMQERKKKKLA